MEFCKSAQLAVSKCLKYCLIDLIKVIECINLSLAQDFKLVISVSYGEINKLGTKTQDHLCLISVANVMKTFFKKNQKVFSLNSDFTTFPNSLILDIFICSYFIFILKDFL